MTWNPISPRFLPPPTKAMRPRASSSSSGSTPSCIGWRGASSGRAAPRSRWARRRCCTRRSSTCRSATRSPFPIVPASWPTRRGRCAASSSTTRAAGMRRSAAASSTSPRSTPTSPTRSTDQIDLPLVGDALDELAKLEPDLAQVVDLKFFCGFSFAEIAAMRGVSERTVQRDWEKARIYLHRSLREDSK